MQLHHRQKPYRKAFENGQKFATSEILDGPNARYGDAKMDSRAKEGSILG